MNRCGAITISAAFLLSALSLSGAPAQGADPRVADLVQVGRIRTALFLPQYTKDQASGELRGVGAGLVVVEVARLLAARVGVEMQVVPYPTISDVMECLKTSTCDVALMGIEPSRAVHVDFSPAVILFDYTYLVPAGSTIQSAADVDRSGIRIAVVRSHAATLVLRRIVKHAELVGIDEMPDTAFNLLRTGKADAFAYPREPLLDYSAKLPGSRVLEDAYGVNRLGIAITKGQAGRLSYISEVIEEAKASGLIQRVIERADLHGFRVAPRENASTK